MLDAAASGCKDAGDLQAMLASRKHRANTGAAPLRLTS